MKDSNIEARLQRIEETLEELVETQKETTDVVQGYLDSLAGTIREAEEGIRSATEEAAERISDSVDAFTEEDDGENNRESVVGLDEEELYEKVREYVTKKGKASTSLLQRRFKIGYGRAARLLGLTLLSQWQGYRRSQSLFYNIGRTTHQHLDGL